jgi:hypothetical protein
MSTTTLIPPQTHTAAAGAIRRNAPMITAASIASLMVILYTWLARWRGITLSIAPQHVLDAMAPLMLAAAFIERAVEVIISPWRDAGATKLGNRLDVLKAQTPPADACEIHAADAAFQEYKGKTQQYAFGVSVSISLSAACVGVRALWPFVNAANFNSLDPNQQWAFLLVDVVLSAALLSGGADGIHSAVNAVTTFFSTTAQKAQQSANAPTS